MNWKHAAGELALIVVGVSIALWADAWVGERLDRQREKARLTALNSDTSNTLEALIAAREESTRAAESLRQIVTLQPSSMSSEQIYEVLQEGLLYGSTFYPEMSVYDDLKSSGELALLKNSNLRQALSRMDAGLERLRVAQEDLITVQTLNLDTYMVEHLDLRSFYGNLTGLDDPDHEVNYDFDFLTDKKFQNRILLKLDLVTWLEYEFSEAESRLRDVKQYVEAELRPESM